MILLFLTVIYGFSVHSRQAEVCDVGSNGITQFGPSCEYLCHCGRHQCDTNTGECLDRTECDAGWMGSGCQYVNIAYKAGVGGNFIGDLRPIVDGTKSKCAFLTNQTKGTTLTIEFKDEINITEVHLLFSYPGDCEDQFSFCTVMFCSAQWGYDTCPKFCHFCASPFNVSVLGTSDTSLCGSVTNTSGQKVFIVKCGTPLYGQRIDVTFMEPRAALAICELQVTGAKACSLGPHNLTRFGPSCEYLCHCGGYQCERNTGECLGGTECDAGWMGSGCQYANIAYEATVGSNYIGNVQEIVDGKTSTCAYLTSQNDYTTLTIDFKPEVNITEVHLMFVHEGDCADKITDCSSDRCTAQWYRDNCPRLCHLCASPFNVSVLGTSETNLCGSVTNTSGQRKFIVKCGMPLYGQSISITFKGAALALCELQAPAGRNLAYGKPAFQSSVVEVYYASNAVDGLPFLDKYWLTCTHTIDSINPWWQLDLQASLMIQWFRIFNRKDQLNERLRYFRILLSQDNETFSQYYQDQSNGTYDPPVIIKVGLNRDALARFIKIDLQGNNRILTLCEVQVYGDCVDGRYGDCNKRCDTCLKQKCDKLTGYCTECAPGYYGDKCSKSCSNCINGDCDKSTGRCHSCNPGKQGDFCQQSCADNYYGNCSTGCGHCRDSIFCDKVSGYCPSGLCSEGWKGEKCDIKCNITHYGENCAWSCGHCLNNTCDRITGNCSEESGCEVGWQGSRCDILLATQVDSTNVAVVGVSVGVAVAIAAIIIAVVIFITVKRRRKQESMASNAPSTRNLARKKEDNIVYENSTFLDLNDPVPSAHELTNKAAESKSKSITNEENQDALPIKENSEPYCNIGSALPSGTISVSNFWDYLQDKFLDEKYFSDEFEKLPSGPQHPTTVAQRRENKNKNRYKQLYAYDVNRVLLKPLGDDQNDYINASFVDGFSHEKMYIASQGTTKDNVNDFWRMLWQNDVEKVVMLTGLFEAGRHKCELYWPEEGGRTSSFGSVAVRLLDIDAFADYDIRTLEMSVGNKSKHLTQFHYTAWPDKGVPKAASSIVQFWNRVNTLPTKKPIVVHCSAGIGRTGTYIALDYLVNQAKVDGHLNVSACVSNLRRQRVNLVQTEEQYIFLHETLVEALMLSGTAIATNQFPKAYQELLEVDDESGMLKLQLEFERLQNDAVSHESVYATLKQEDEEGIEENSNQNEYSAAMKLENTTKNRHYNILPVDQHRVALYTHVSGGNDYINAVFLPSHRQRQAFILTQTPLTSTISDFWRMIHEFEIKTIIMFDSKCSKTHEIGIYWPKDGEMLYGPFSVRLTNEEKHKGYTERTLSVVLNGHDCDRTVRQFQFINWADNADVPESTESILQLLDAVEAWQKEMEAKPVVVHCMNGAQKSGLYCVISTVLERLKIEGDVAIAQTIKRLWVIRQQIIPNYAQFRFCHECVLQYMKTFETYSNF